MMGQARVSRMAAVDCWSSLILTLFIGALGLACDSGSRDEPEALPPPEHSQAGNTDEQQDELVSFTAAEIEEFELRVAPAGKAIIERFIELPGVVRANEDRLAHIVPRFAGIVTKVRRRIG
ncbi:MAG: hypothetical protein JRG80_12980, partial [Deltaproteobacteria bacterium]|nr:hypothetical protein [Deltaproteobacteria bacterium]